MPLVAVRWQCWQRIFSGSEGFVASASGGVGGVEVEFMGHDESEDTNSLQYFTKGRSTMQARQKTILDSNDKKSSHR